MGFLAVGDVKELRVFCVKFAKLRFEIIANFVIIRADAGAEYGRHIFGSRPQFTHGRNGALDDAAQRAAPPCMTGSDNACFGIGE